MHRIAFASLFLSLVTPVHAAHAQVRASEKASVSQTVDGTTFTVTYARPRARGRTGLFGTQVHRGEVWTPGANHATALAVTKDVTIDGVAVKKGAYSVWIETGDKWEMILDPDTSLWHTQRPKKRENQVRFTVTPQKRPFMEVLTWWFPEVTATGATLAMQWDTVYVSLRLGVPSTFTTAIAPAKAKRLVGTYNVHAENLQARRDTKASSSLPSFDTKLTITQEGEGLRVVMDPPLYQDPAYREWSLLSSSGGWFYLARTVNGEIVEIEDSYEFQFDKSGDRADKFEIRLINDDLLAKGQRTK